MADVDYLYENDQTGQLGIGADGKAFRKQPGPVANQTIPGSSIPVPSLTGQSRPAVGMGGSVPPPVAARAATPAVKEEIAANVRQPQRSLSPDEMQALADAIIGQFQSQQVAKPSAVEPALEQEYNVPYWLREYAQKEGLTKSPGK